VFLHGDVIVADRVYTYDTGKFAAGEGDGGGGGVFFHDIETYNLDKSWKMTTGRPLLTLEGHLAPVNSVAFHPSGTRLASASKDGTIRLWNTKTGACLAVLLATPEGWAACAPEGRYKFGGDLARSFWQVIGLCRFEPGELDPYLPRPLRMADGEPLWQDEG
jgi:hypothetical protein